MKQPIFSPAGILLVPFVISTIAAWAAAQVGWRGDGSGVYPDADPPVHWSTETNVVWSTKLSGRSNALPVVVGDRVFVCSEPFDLLCLNAADGKVVWRRTNTYRDISSDQQWLAVEKELKLAAPLQKRLDGIRERVEALRKQAGDAANAATRTAESEQLESEATIVEKQLAALPLAARYTVPKTEEQFNGYTTATPTSDGKRVWAVFGNRAVVCYDMEGKLVWSDVLADNPQSMWGHSSSPLLVDDKLIVNIERTVALDALTGRPLWQTRHGQSWGSAIRTDIGGQPLILLANGRILRAADGKVLQRVAGLPNTSPVVRDGVAYYIDIRAEAHELPVTLVSDADELEVKTRWSTELKGGTFFGSAIVHDGLIYAVSTRQILNVIEAETGQPVYVRRLELGEQPAWPSLCLAGPYLYVSGRDGTTLVLERGREYKEVARNQLEYFISTPVFHGNRMYVRTSERLYCIGKVAE